MIDALKSLFGPPPREEPGDWEQRTRLAAAALLIEMTRADQVVAEEERQTLRVLLPGALDIAPGQVDELLRQANEAADEATSLYQFTQLINRHYQRRQKVELIHAMWRVAYADGDLDKYEEGLIRQVADLIHVTHKDYIRTKIKAGDAASTAGT